MTTTQRAECANCHKTHRDPNSGPARACAAALAAIPAQAAAPTVETDAVTARDLLAILTGLDAALVALRGPVSFTAMVAPWWTVPADDVLADRDYVHSLVRHHHGSLAAAALDLSQLVAWERTQAVTR